MKIKIVRILKCKKGETIIESIISLLLFAVLIIGVTEMISAALKITGNSIENAGATQKSVNDIVLEDGGLATESDSITFESASTGIISVTHGIDVIIDDSNITAFMPQG